MIKRKALILQLEVRMHSWLLFLGPLPHRWTWRTFIQFEVFVTAQGFACILPRATLNMRWASLTFSLSVCYGPSPLLCLFEQFFPATPSSAIQHDISSWLLRISTTASETLKLRPESMCNCGLGTTIWSHYHQPLKDLNKMEMVRLWSPAGW